jgi:nucleotidyltransferase substrate binding protein (TIGR01987 family)
MQTKHLSIAPLEKALESLDRSIVQPKNEFTRDSVIQRFEYTLELSWKTAKKYLESQGISPTTPKEAIREAAKAGWINNAELWMTFIEKRNLTSHIYQEKIAVEVYETALRLPQEARALIECLKKL